MNKIIARLKQKSIPQLVAYAALILGLVVDIIFLAVDLGDFTFTLGCFICLLLGSIVGLIDFFFELRGTFLWLACLLYITGLGFHIYAGLQSVSDLWNGVNFIGGNQTAAIAFGIVFLLITLVLAVVNFFGKKRAE